MNLGTIQRHVCDMLANFKDQRGHRGNSSGRTMIP
jgi:hypothetical protein